MRMDVRALVTLGVLATVVLGCDAARAANGDEAVAQVLTVAVPKRLVDAPSGALTLTAVLGHVQGRVARRVCPGPLCTDRGNLQIQLAVGSDYEILDWLGKGFVDAGVISTLSWYLLRADQIDLLEIEPRPVEPAVSAPQSWHRASGVWRDDAESRRDFEAARYWIWCRTVMTHVAGRETPVEALEKEQCRARLSRDETPYELVMPSHLSTSGFLLPIAETAKWLSERAPLARGIDPPTTTQRALTEEFWAELFARTRFVLGGPDPRPEPEAGPAIAIVFREGATARAAGVERARRTRSDTLDLSPDHLVIRRTRKIFSTRALAKHVESGELSTTPTISDALDRLLGAGPSVPRVFRSLRFSEPSFGVRTFAFTVDESLELLRHHHDDVAETRLAVVLPGGGVKAAYQARLLDYLYSKGHLRNFETPVDPLRRALPVNYVIGTSGGALLGFFVARLTENGPWRLSDILWKRCDEKVPDRCRALRTTDVFGWIDLPRYVSLLIVFVVFWVVLGLRNVIWPLDAEGPGPTKAWRLPLWFVMTPILVLTPFLIRHANGTVAREHIPVIEGFFYAILALIAMFVDQCVIRDDAGPRTVRRGWRLVGVGLTMAGLAAIALCLLAAWSEWPRWLSHVDSRRAIQDNALLACVAALLLLAGATLWTYTCLPRYVVRGIGGFCAGVGLAFLVIGLVYLIIASAVRLLPGSLSLLELTRQFWVWLLGATLLISVVILGLDALVRPLDARRPSWVRRGVRCISWIRTGVRYLSDRHPNGRLVARRSSRLFLTAIVAVAWWNFVVAPGLYGNDPARRFMDRVIDQFDRAYQSANLRSSTRLASTLIVPANDLDNNQTAYFLFTAQTDCPSVVKRPGDAAVWRRYRVPVDAERPEGASDLAIVSCDDGQEAPREYFKKVVFASGSPFPVFPAHAVDKRLLVDGGYSNLVPLDAALTVAAEAVLIVGSSSPLDPESTGDAWWTKVPGELVRKSPRVLGFLYERSQQVDRLSRSDLLVVSLAPRRDEPNWPLLTDFRPDVVRRMIRTAEDDLSRRIGLVQSWGRPRFVRTLAAPASGRVAK